VTYNWADVKPDIPPANASLVVLNKLEVIYLGFAGRTKETSI